MLRFFAPRALLALLVASAALVRTADAADVSPARVRLIEPAKAIEDFELVSQSGQRLRFSALRGQPVLVFLGFTHCPDVCPATLHKLKLVEAQLQKAKVPAKVVMLSVDGERDTPERLRAMLQPLSPRFIGMTGPSAQMKKIAAQFSGVFFKGLPNGPGGDYTVDHTSQIYLVDASGALRAMLFNPDVADIVSATKQLRTARG